MNKKVNSFGKGVSIFLFVIGMIVLWTGSCGVIAMLSFGIGGIAEEVSRIIMRVGCFISTALVIWLSIRFSRNLNKNKTAKHQATLK